VEKLGDTFTTSTCKADFFSVGSLFCVNLLHCAPGKLFTLSFCFTLIEETFPKNIATSIKDERFLNFFFTRIRWARPKDIKFLDDIGVAADYPFVSPCGKEINHIRPAATPIVFHSLINQDLIYAGNLTLPFEHSQLALSEKTGRLYHQLYDPKEVINTKQSSSGLTTLGYGLVRSTVAVALSERILPGPGEMEEENMLFLTPEGPVPIQCLPHYAEPGAWVLPGDGSN
jgi:hypothetical protein